MRIQKCFVGLLCIAWTTVTSGMFLIPEPVPVDRIIASAQRQVQADPNGAEGHYTLGRAHYLAWSLKSLTIPGFARGRQPVAAPDWMIGGDEQYVNWLRREEASKRVREKLNLAEGGAPPQDFGVRVQTESKAMEAADWAPPVVPQKELDDHAVAGLKELQKAVKLDPNSGLSFICLASLQDEFAGRAAELRIDLDGSTLPDGVKIDPLAFARKWRNEAAKGYAKAYELAIGKDRALPSRPAAGLQSLVSYSAIKSYLHLAGESFTPRGRQEVPASQQSADTDKALVAAMKQDLQKLDALLSGAITPVVFSADARGVLADRLSPEQHVRFDLNGDGVAENRTWLKPTTGLLVWDPAMTGSITSGRQLFGNVTWWLFWKDGYAALAALDDNGDGELAGKELIGIAAWFDRNSNGVSDAGEVQPIGSLGIAGIACIADGTEMLGATASPRNSRGIRFFDGRVVPSFDWIEGAN